MIWTTLPTMPPWSQDFIVLLQTLKQGFIFPWRASSADQIIQEPQHRDMKIIGRECRQAAERILGGGRCGGANALEIPAHKLRVRKQSD